MTLISVTKVGKLCPKPKTNHESPKRRKHEKRIRGKGCFVISSFRVFVIKNKIRHNFEETFNELGHFENVAQIKSDNTNNISTNMIDNTTSNTLEATAIIIIQKIDLTINSY